MYLVSVKPKNYRRKTSRQSGLLKTTTPVAPPDPEAEQLVQQLLAALPALLLVAVVDTASGQCRAGWSGMQGVEPQQVATYGAAVVRHQQASEALQQAGEKLTEISFFLSTQLHLLQALSDGQQFIYLVGERTTISLGLARELLRRGQLMPA